VRQCLAVTAPVPGSVCVRVRVHVYVCICVYIYVLTDICACLDVCLCAYIIVCRYYGMYVVSIRKSSVYLSILKPANVRLTPALVGSIKL